MLYMLYVKTFISLQRNKIPESIKRTENLKTFKYELTGFYEIDFGKQDK